MTRRYLFGPATERFVEENLRQLIQDGECIAFNADGSAGVAIGFDDTWDALLARLPGDWRPDFIALDLDYVSAPRCLWQAPVPLVALAQDWNLLWHAYRRLLRHADFVLTDTAGVERLALEGITYVHAANLFGLECGWLSSLQTPETDRDIDILFVGNLNPAVQRERMAWLGRIARRTGVRIAQGIFGEDYRRLARRARIMFNRSIRGECNLRAFEAAAAGALLFQEAGNLEVPRYFRDRQECIYYTDENLEELLDYYLEHEDERRAIVDAARERVGQFTFAMLWAEHLRTIDEDWPEIEGRARRRCAEDKTPDLTARLWQALCNCTPARDETLVPELAAALETQPGSAELRHALGLVTKGEKRALVAAEHFGRAVSLDPGHLMAGLNLVEALAASGQRAEAMERARLVLHEIEEVSRGGAEFAEQTSELVAGSESLRERFLDSPHWVATYDYFRVEWEHAAWEHAGDAPGEARAKLGLLRWRLHHLLADLTGELAHYYEAVLTRPDLPTTRAALGCALARAGRPAVAVPHLHAAHQANPFDLAAARALYQALEDSGDNVRKRVLARERSLLARAAPLSVPVEPWFAEVQADAPAVVGRFAKPSHAGGNGLAKLPTTDPDFGLQATDHGLRTTDLRSKTVALCMIVKNEEHNLPACLETVRGLFDEIIVVDTGSTDRTREIAGQLQVKLFDFTWVDSFAAARNECLRHAGSNWIFWMDADDRLDAVNHQKLHTLLAGLGDENAAYVLQCVCPPARDTGVATAVEHVRLFRNHPQIRWEHRIHEQILPAVRRQRGELRYSDVIVQHTGYVDPELRCRKRERDLRLLLLEQAEQPHHPFTLFNLGMTYLDMQRPAQALPFLEESLTRSDPKDSIVRKLFYLIVQCQRQLKRAAAALAICQRCRKHYPRDAELLSQEGQLRFEQGDSAGAEACYLQLLTTEEGRHWASVPLGLHGYRTRHNLAVLYHQQGRYAEAEAQWRLAMAEQPDFLPSRRALEDLQVAQHA